MFEIMAIVYWIISAVLIGLVLKEPELWDDDEHVKSPLMRDLLIIFVIFAWFIALPIGLVRRALEGK